MTTRPVTEETPEQLAQRVVDTWGEGNPPIVVLARALLSTSAAVRGMREALEKADHALTYAIIRMERDFLVGKLEATQKTVRAALSGIEGEDEQARPSGSAPISTDTKGTTNA